MNRRFGGRNRVFEQSWRALGWTVGQDLKIDYCMAGGAADRMRQYAAELVALAADVLMPIGSGTVAPVNRPPPPLARMGRPAGSWGARIAAIAGALSGDHCA